MDVGVCVCNGMFDLQHNFLLLTCIMTACCNLPHSSRMSLSRPIGFRSYFGCWFQRWHVVPLIWFNEFLGTGLGDVGMDFEEATQSLWRKNDVASSSAAL